MEVAVVSLSTREQHALHGIEDRLIGSDPKLAALLATFNGLASDEEMPSGEMFTAARRDRRGAHGLPPGPALRRAAPLMWVLIAIVTIAALATISGRASRDACLKSWTVTCVSPAHSAGLVRKTAAGPAPPPARPVPAALRPSG
jgi:Protein of unknown function (DUF3040)